MKDLNIYNRKEITIDENFQIKKIKFIEHRHNVHGIRQFKLLIDLEENMFRGYISSSLINKDRLEFLENDFKKKCRNIYKKYHGLKVLDKLFIKDVQNIILSFLII